MSADEDEDDDFDEVDDDEIVEDFEEIDDTVSELKYTANARRRLEELMEERELQRLLRGDIGDWD